jgi:lipopolysaccharide export system protein LptC
MRPTGSVSSEDRAKLADYDKWLRAQSKAVRSLAERASAATTRQIQLAFNQQYLALQQRMEQEHKGFNSVANIMKAKHDAALKAIGNTP